ncbi:hypothetical protein SNE40_012311 [Patella caerulea]|uniref:Protein LTV1 homolog n=1 Tax=Patella caerulea TaxID=87958 RepID=A0AAN8PVQ2_PATCE
MPKKKFIDKKNSVTFTLVHRSQRDPLIANDRATSHVLLPIDNKESRKEEERKFGVFYEDEYNYLQHLRDANEISELEPVERTRIHKSDLKKDKVAAQKEGEGSKEQNEEEKNQDKPNISLPSSVFASTLEAKTGLLNKAAPRKGPLLEWDPDIVAALDDDFDYDDEENILDDDFITKANAPVEGEEEMVLGRGFNDGDGSDIASDEADMFSDDDDDSKERDEFEKEETKSRFTNYSMTSSVIRRNEGLTLLDDRFEKFYEQYYDEEIGALDEEDIDGTVSTKSALMKQILKEFKAEQKEKSRKLKEVIDEAEIKITEDDIESGDEDMIDLVIEEPKEKWDCESIISTYSNLYNHPKLISEPSNKERKIKLTSRLGIPVDSLGLPGLTRRQIEKEMRESRRADTASTYRPKGETLEEKKIRKQAIKEERKTRRLEKKTNKVAFNAEKLKQEKDLINVQKNVQGIKLS